MGQCTCTAYTKYFVDVRQKPCIFHGSGKKQYADWKRQHKVGTRAGCPTWGCPAAKQTANEPRAYSTCLAGGQRTKKKKVQSTRRLKNKKILAPCRDATFEATQPAGVVDLDAWATSTAPVCFCRSVSVSSYAPFFSHGVGTLGRTHELTQRADSFRTSCERQHGTDAGQLRQPRTLRTPQEGVIGTRPPQSTCI